MLLAGKGTECSLKGVLMQKSGSPLNVSIVYFRTETLNLDVSIEPKF